MSVHKNSLRFAMKGAVILTIAGLITKILSAAYRVPYQNIVGDIGFYIYQQVYPFYGMSILLATTGYPVMISKVMTDYGLNQTKQIRSKVLTISFIYLGSTGLILFSLLYIFAKDIAMYMGDPALTQLIQITSISFLITPMVSIFRGYFQSEQNMQPTAVTQVVEQGIRVTLILISSYFMINAGYGLYETGVVAFLGSIIASIVVLVMFLHLWVKKGYYLLIGWNLSAPIHTWKVLSSLLKYSWTIGISSLLLILIQLIDALNLYSLLIEGGMNEVLAKETKGIYDRGQPLIQLGTVVASAFSLSLVPAIASAKIQNNFRLINEKLNLSIKVCVVIGSGASVGLIAIMKPTNVMLFTNNAGSFVLMILSASILFTSLCLTMFAILHGLGFTLTPAVTVLIGVFIKYLANIWLIPKYGVTGAAVSTVFSYSIVALITILVLVFKGYIFRENKKLIQTSFALVGMFGLLNMLLKFLGFIIDLDTRTYAAGVSLSTTFIGACFYGWALIKLNVFTDSELKHVPLIKRIQKKEMGDR